MFLTKSQYHYSLILLGKKGMQQPCSGDGPCYVNYPSALLEGPVGYSTGHWAFVHCLFLLLCKEFSACLNDECM